MAIFHNEKITYQPNNMRKNDSYQVQFSLVVQNTTKGAPAEYH